MKIAPRNDIPTVDWDNQTGFSSDDADCSCGCRHFGGGLGRLYEQEISASGSAYL